MNFFSSVSTCIDKRLILLEKCISLCITMSLAQKYRNNMNLCIVQFYPKYVNLVLQVIFFADRQLILNKYTHIYMLFFRLSPSRDHVKMLSLILFQLSK